MTMVKQHNILSIALALLVVQATNAWAGELGNSVLIGAGELQTRPKDTTGVKGGPAGSSAMAPLLNLWGLDVLVSNDGFGLGTFYRRQFTEDLYGIVSFSISESKDEREMERFDPYTGLTYVPGKLNRFLVLPLTFGLQYRLFREDIVETFRPYVNAGAGPTMIYVMPFVNRVVYADGYVESQQVDFFKSIGKGRPHYTASVYIGFGANFGGDRTNVFGLNFRYYFTYLYSAGLPSLYNPTSGEITGEKTSFGGFFITINIGMGY